MVQRQQQSLTRRERRLVGWVLGIALAATTLWFLFAPGSGVFQYHRLQKQIETLSQENKNLQERNEDLRKEIERLQNDESYLEYMARQKYGLLKENETVYEFTPPKKKKE
jgi:cell division protein FtsB